MKAMKWFVLISLVAGFFQCPLFPKISSRVQGKVIDKDTKQPIQGAKVQLIYLWISPNYSRERNWDKEILTDKNGNFKFDLQFSFYPISKFAFYLQCEKKGYISLIPSIYLKYRKDEKFPEVAGVFTLEEGKIKHFAIELEKGGGLKGTIYKREASGISPFSNVSGYLERKANPNISLLRDEKDGYSIASIYTDDNGKFEIDGIEPFDDYYILLLGDGYNIPYIEGIKIDKNITENFEYVIDLTDQTGIEGFIKIGQDFAEGGLVAFYKNNIDETSLTKKDRGGSAISETGYYSLKGINPGTYRMYVFASYKLKQYRKDFVIEIVEGTTKVFNIDL